MTQVALSPEFFKIIVPKSPSAAPAAEQTVAKLNSSEE
jgi:hypothetical protein